MQPRLSWIVLPAVGLSVLSAPRHGTLITVAALAGVSNPPAAHADIVTSIAMTGIL